MVAIVGIPGSQHHLWARFNHRASASLWLDREWRRVRERNPAIGTLPAEILSERKAAKVRYRDGKRCYAIKQADTDP